MNNSTSLKKKVRYFFDKPEFQQDVLGSFIIELKNKGRLAVIGGLVRDIALSGGSGKFKSDLDFVISDIDMHFFEKLMWGCKAIKNRFGGYRATIGKRKVDIWSIEQTWARVEKHRRVEKLEDLTSTTFFNWDAILYDLSNEKLIYNPDYFSNLKRCFLDINLYPNPNPVGNAIRAIRLATKFPQIVFGRTLTSHLYETLNEMSDSQLIEIEMQSLHTTYLKGVNFDELRERLGPFSNNDTNDEFSPRLSQKIEQLDLLAG